MDRRLRWGILGSGNIARQFAAGLRQSGRCVGAAVGSRDLEKARAFAAAHGIPVAHGSYAALIADPAVDAVYNSLPNSLHHAWTIAALRAGKDVLCEKPLASNAAEAEEMFAVAAATGRALIEAFMYRSHPQTLAVEKAVAAGAIGKLALIKTSFTFRTRHVDGNIRFDPSLAGGAMMDIGCYCVNFSRHFAGADPEKILAVGRRHTSGVDDMAAVSMRFPGGILAEFSCGMHAQADNTATLCGEEGYLQIPVPWKPIGKAGFCIRRGIPPKMDQIATAASPSPAPAEQWHSVQTEGDVYAIEADDFAATIFDGQPVRITPADSIGNMRVLDVIRRQIADGWE